MNRIKTIKTKTERVIPIDMDEPYIKTIDGTKSLQEVKNIYDSGKVVSNLYVPADCQKAVRTIGTIYEKAFWEKAFATENGWKPEVTFWNYMMQKCKDNLMCIHEQNISIGTDGKMARMTY